LLSAIFSTAADPASRTSVKPVLNNFSVCEFMGMSRHGDCTAQSWETHASATRMNKL
jgi:hypothetical protein